MKNFSILFLLISFSINVFSQDFKNVYESIQVNDRFSNMMNLQHYQAVNPNHAIVYFLLGEINDAYMRETDPLNMFAFLEANFRQVQTYYSLVNMKLDDKQARQDREYFGEVELTSDKRKVGLPDILNETAKRLASSTAYFENAKSVHDNYINCITKYNSCLFKYREILHDYANYKALYLLITPDLIAEIKEMALNFDTALVAFDTYKVSCSKLSHLFKVNTYRLNPITTYRLEGLVEADFEDQVVELWDFKTWATQFLALMDTDIAQIRSGLIENDNALNKQIDKLITHENYADDMPFYQPEDKFKNLIGKYDHLSLCNELIEYKQSKVDFLLQTRLIVNDINDSASFFLINKLRFFAGLSENLVLLNAQADELKASISIDDISKYVDFFRQQYNGMDGFTRWCVVEKYNNQQLFNHNLAHLEEFITRDQHKFDYCDSVLVFKKKVIPFGNQYQVPDSIVRDTMITRQLVPYSKHLFYLGGEEMNTKNKAKAFLSQVGSSGKVNWMVYPHLKGGSESDNTYISHLQVLGDSTCYVAAYAADQLVDSVVSVHTFIDKYNWNGKLEKQTVRESQSIPVYFWADEINEQYFMAEKSIIDSSNCCLFSFSLHNFNDSLVWRRSIQLEGDLVNVVLTNSNFFIICNYHKLMVPQIPVALCCDGNQQGVCTIYLTRQGEFKSVNDYRTPKVLSVSSGVKITNNSINLFGRYIDLENAESKLFYLLVDEEGTPVYSNLEALQYKSTLINN